MPNTPQEADAHWRAALQTRNQDAAAEVLHADYALVLVHPAPARMARAAWLATLPVYVISGWEELESSWDVRDTVAAHLHTVDMRAVVGGTERNGIFVLSDIWLREDDGRWLVWLRHSSPLSAGVLPEPPAPG